MKQCPAHHPGSCPFPR